MSLSILRPMLLSGASVLAEHKEQLNKINVFPIPDGDTGTNMVRTIMGAVRVLTEEEDRELTEEDFNDLYNGVLMSSQGNSGVILSQWFKGFFASIKYAEDVTAASMNEAFLYAMESAYAAVASPVEGTFLTVAREAQEMAEESLEEDTSLEDYLTAFLENARISLENTPEKLPVLKEAGVVDSGGMGFVYLISGMLQAINEDYVIDSEILGKIGAEEGVVAKLRGHGSVELDKFGYCTELIVSLSSEKEKDFSLSSAIAFMNQEGNSVVAVQDRNTVKIHVHTFKPENVLGYFHNYGEFTKLKIENMSLQHHEMMSEQKKDRAVVAVVNGSGIAKVFRSMGADVVLERDAHSELSVGEVSDAVFASNARQVILLVDDKNLHLLATGVKQVCRDIPIFSVMSVSAADVYAALTILDAQSSAEELSRSMQETVQESIPVIIKQSDEISNFHELDIVPGDYVACVNGTFTDNYKELDRLLEAVFQNLPDAQDMESVMIFCSTQEALEKIKPYTQLINRFMPDAEIFLEYGGQEESMYVISVQ